MSEQNNERVKISFPAKWVATEKKDGTEFQITNADKSKSWPGVMCTLPTGTKVGDKDLSGFKFSTFRKPWNKADIEAGRGTSVEVNANRDVSLFKFDKDGSRIDEAVNPTELAQAVKDAREEYRAQHPSREQSQEHSAGLDEICDAKSAEAADLEAGNGREREGQNPQR